MIKLSSFLQLLLTSIIIAATYELKLLPQWNTSGRLIFVIVGSVVASKILASGLSVILVRIRLVRKIFLNRSWIEGYWHLRTYESDQKEPVSHVLMEISYVPHNYELLVVGHKLRAPEGILRSISNSKLATINPKSLEYVNFFEYRPTTTTIYGVAHGNFYIDGWHWYPTRYDGTLRYFSEIKDQRQIGEKISDFHIFKLMLKYREQWLTYLLAEMEAVNGPGR